MTEETTTAIITQDPNPLSLIQQALTQGVDPETLRQFMELQKTWNSDQALKAFNMAMNACESEMPAVVREKENGGTNKKYAPLEAVASVIKPVYTKHGFSLSFTEQAADESESGEAKKFVHIKGFLRHKDGHSADYETTLPMDGTGSGGRASAMNATQAKGSTLTYARRYLTCLIFNVAIKDEDRDGEFTAVRISEDAIATLNGMIEACRNVGKDVDMKRFYKAVGVADGGDLSDIVQAKFLTAVEMLTKKLSSKAGVTA